MGKQNIQFHQESLEKIETLFGYCDFTNDGRPFYVGIGNLKRVKNLRRNKKHTNVTAKHGQNRMILVRLTGLQKLTHKWLCYWEIQNIEKLHTKHAEGNIGCNFTIGGDGIRGFYRIKSKEECQKVSNAQKLRYQDPAEHLKTSIAIKKAKADPIKLANHAKAQQLRYSDPVKRHRMHETNSQKKCVQQFTMDDVFVCEYPSMSYAVRETGIQNIKKVCWGKRPHAGGFKWYYVEKDTQ